jgi:putative SOS response-associated peptidase YedK
MIVYPPDEELWLDPRSTPDSLGSLLVPFAADQMETFPVNPYMSNTKNEGPRCLKRVDVS